MSTASDGTRDSQGGIVPDVPTPRGEEARRELLHLAEELEEYARRLAAKQTAHDHVRWWRNGYAQAFRAAAAKARRRAS